jgi:hypothetical protein
VRRLTEWNRDSLARCTVPYSTAPQPTVPRCASFPATVDRLPERLQELLWNARDAGIKGEQLEPVPQASAAVVFHLTPLGFPR